MKIIRALFLSMMSQWSFRPSSIITNANMRGISLDNGTTETIWKLSKLIYSDQPMGYLDTFRMDKAKIEESGASQVLGGQLFELIQYLIGLTFHKCPRSNGIHQTFGNEIPREEIQSINNERR
ncbi:hypothetical protein CR513_17140, partial [Mucuna pruriens]